MKKILMNIFMSLMVITCLFSLAGCGEKPTCMISLSLAAGQTSYELYADVIEGETFTSDSCYIVKNGETPLFQVVFQYYDANVSETNVYSYQNAVNYVDVLSGTSELDDQNRIYYPNETADYNVYLVNGMAESLLDIVDVALGNDEYMYNGSYRLNVGSVDILTLKIVAKN